MFGFGRIISLYHFLSERSPKEIPLVEPKPRKPNPWCDQGRALVAKVKAVEDIRSSIDKAIALLGVLREVIDRGNQVMVKPNFNSPNPFPASTGLTFLRAVLEVLLEIGTRVTIGESSGALWWPSRNVFGKLGVYELARYMGVRLIAFEDETTDWVRVKVNGEYLDEVTVPRSAYEADRMIYLPCMKTHFIAGFSGALKLAVGFMHPSERLALHARHLNQKIAEISLCWQPDLILMDGRKAFVSGGPDTGQLVEPGLVLASGDLVAIDVEAMKVLLTYEAKNKLVADPWQSPQIVAALKHNLGVKKDGYTVFE